MRYNVDPASYDVLANRTIHAFPHLSFPNLSVSSPSAYCRNRSMAVLSGALLSGEAATARANERQRRRFLVAPAPISSKFHCPRPPWLVCTPDQNRHATQAKIWPMLDVFASRRFWCLFWCVCWTGLWWYRFQSWCRKHMKTRMSASCQESSR